MMLHSFKDSVYPTRVILINHRFGVPQAINPIGHQTLVFREPRLELDKTADAASPRCSLALGREGCSPSFIFR